MEIRKMITLNDYLYSGDTVLRILIKYIGDLQEDAKRNQNEIDMIHCSFLLQVEELLEHNDFLTAQSQKIREFYKYMVAEYPYLSFEQGEYNSFYFSEEILSTLDHNKNIKVRDRATLFNLVIGLNGYTVSSGVISKELNGETIIAKPLAVSEFMKIGTITQKDMPLSRYGTAYMEYLKKYIPTETDAI